MPRLSDNAWIRRLIPSGVVSLRKRLFKSALGERLARGVFWSTAGAVISRSLALIGSIVTARFLGKAGFGEFAIIQNTALMFGTFAGFSMGLTATKYVAEYRGSDPRLAGRVIGLTAIISWASGSLMAIAVAIFAPWLAAHTLGAPQLTGLLRLCSLCVLFNVVSDAQLGTLSGLEAFKRRSVIQLISGFASFPLAVVGVWVWGIDGAVVAVVISQLLIVILNYLGIRKECRDFGIKVARPTLQHEGSIFWRFSLPAFLGGIIYVPSMWIANMIVVNQPNGYADMGIFNAADRWRTIILFLPNMLGGVALPLLSNLRSSAVPDQHDSVLWTNVKLSFIIALAAALPIALGSYWIMASYGPGFVEGRWILAGLCVQAVLSATSWILIQSVVSQGRMWLMLIMNFLWAMLLLIPCWYLRAHGAGGLLAGYLAADGSRFIIMLYIARKRGSDPEREPATGAGNSTSGRVDSCNAETTKAAKIA